MRGQFELVTAPGAVGETVAREVGFEPRVVAGGRTGAGDTSAEDTISAARAMIRLPADLLLFAGGDGTARDIYTAVGAGPPVLGIPAGVKIHSAVFATHPRAAGEIAAAHLKGERQHLRQGEVVNLDEDAYRAGNVSTRLYGYLTTPFRARQVQGQKRPTPAAEAARADAIAAEVVEGMQAGWLYILGPGTTSRAIAARLGFSKTLVGVDVYTRAGVVQLARAKIVVTPIGGQGFLFGRGNQPLSPRVLRQVGRANILIVSLAEKLNALRGSPLLVDSGEAELDEWLSGYFPVITGYRETVIYRVSA